jgi:hypothetical protein
MKNINFNHGKYRIVKYLGGEYHDFGSYPSENVALYVRDMLDENGWKIPFKSTTIFMLDDVFHVLHNVSLDGCKASISYVGGVSSRAEAEILAGNPLGEKYLNNVSGGYSIVKTIDKKVVSFGYFKDHDVAYDMRDYLISCDWQLPSHNKEYTICINDTMYMLLVQKGKIKVISSEDLRNIYHAKNGYSISRVVDKKRYNYKTYKTLEEAKSMRAFLREHNWDTKLFEEEYDRRYPSLPEYIYNHNGGYQVRRKWKGITKSYGIYTTLPEAKNRVQYLEEHNWQTSGSLNIVNYDGIFHVYKSIPSGFCTPFRKYYYSTEDKEHANIMVERFKEEGFPQPYLVTNKYRYIIRNRQLFYVMHHGRKMCYSRKLRDALVARDILELLCWKELGEGVYCWDGVEYVVELNSFGTPVFMRR